MPHIMIVSWTLGLCGAFTTVEAAHALGSGQPLQPARWSGS